MEKDRVKTFATREKVKTSSNPPRLPNIKKQADFSSVSVDPLAEMQSPASVLVTRVACLVGKF